MAGCRPGGSRWAGAVVVAGCLVAASAATAQPAGEAWSKEAAAARGSLDLKIVFRPFVFKGPAFPSPEFDSPDRARRLLGNYTLRARFLDRAGREVESAERPGPYAAIVAIAPEEGRPSKRFATLYHLAGALPDDPGPPGSPRDFWRAAAISPLVTFPQRPLVLITLRGRPRGELVRDPAVARMLAGLAMSGPSPTAHVPRAEDAFGRERQFWVDRKRQLYGTARAYPDPVACPDAIDGDPAPTIRPGSPEEAGVRPDTAEKIDAVCRRWAADTDQAFAICVARRGVIVLHEAYGERLGRPMTVDTPSWMASVTKPMSASLMMMLVDRGLIDLDDPVEKVLPPLRGLRGPDQPPLTIRHLYTHTNGLEKWLPGTDEWPDFEERVAVAYPFLEVGKAWAYNGAGYALGGKVIEAISGEAVPAFYRKHLLIPLGCTGTEVVGTHADMRSIPLDMAKFAQMLLNEGAYGSRRFFRRETFRRMLPKRLDDVLGPDATKVFGIGLDGNGRQIGHGAASSATFSIDRDEQLVVIMCRNRQGKNDEKFNGPFWEAIRGGIIPGK